MTVVLSTLEYERLSELARTSGLTVSEFSRSRLLSARAEIGPVIEEAFRRLEGDETQASGQLENGQLEKRHVSELGRVVEVNHSCAHHAAVVGADAVERRTCCASTQFGRPCYFPSNKAPDCLYFRPRK